MPDTRLIPRHGGYRKLKSFQVAQLAYGVMGGKKQLLISCCFAYLGMLYPVHASAQSAAIDTSVAHQYFREAQKYSDRDGGKLWGRSLYGPMLFVDPATHSVVANQNDLQGQLTKKDEIYVGRLPDKQPVANFATTWAGIKWTMIVWPLIPKDDFQRVGLMLHESFHRIQSDLGLAPSNPSNDHLDSLDGRIWLQLEWSALRKALTSGGSGRREAAEDALTFRNHRRALFPNSESSERALEMNEGLAQYTGYKLSAGSDTELIDRLAKQIDDAAKRPTFVRSFAYVSGPVYGALLDASGAKWRQGLSDSDDLGSLLQTSMKIKLSGNLRARAETEAAKYGRVTLEAMENERELARRKRIAEYKARLVDGHTLLIPLADKGNFSFDPNNLIPLDSAGTVYPTATIKDDWGALEVSNGALLIREGGRVRKIFVSIPADVNARPLKGNGWTLELTAGWKLTPGQREGDLVLTSSR